MTNGTRIYNHGDMANLPHFGTIVRSYTDDWGSHLTIQADDGDTYTIRAAMISPEFKGHSGTRIVTEAAYLAWHTAQLAKLNSRHISITAVVA